MSLVKDQRFNVQVYSYKEQGRKLLALRGAVQRVDVDVLYYSCCWDLYNSEIA